MAMPAVVAEMGVERVVFITGCKWHIDAGVGTQWEFARDQREIY